MVQTSVARTALITHVALQRTHHLTTHTCLQTLHVSMFIQYVHTSTYQYLKCRCISFGIWSVNMLGACAVHSGSNQRLPSETVCIVLDQPYIETSVNGNHKCRLSQRQTCWFDKFVFKLCKHGRLLTRKCNN